jgi:hypothetical protein
MADRARVSRKAVTCLGVTFIAVAGFLTDLGIAFVRLTRPNEPWETAMLVLLVAGLLAGAIGWSEINRSDGRLKGKSLLISSLFLTAILLVVGLYAPFFFMVRHAAERKRQRDLNDQLYPGPNQPIEKPLPRDREPLSPARPLP